MLYEVIMDQTENTDRRIDQEPTNVRSSIRQFPLQEIVNGNPDIREVAKEITDTRLDGIGRNFVIALGNGLENGIHAFVDGKHGSVEAFKRVFRVACIRGAPRQYNGGGHNERHTLQKLTIHSSFLSDHLFSGVSDALLNMN